MTKFEKDMFKVLCGAGGEVVASRERQLAGFLDEHLKCLNPFRKELLRSEIVHLYRELDELRNQQKLYPKPTSSRSPHSTPTG